MTSTDGITAAHTPHINPDEMAEVREQIGAMRPRPETFMELRGLALQLVDDLEAAYARLDVAYQRLDQDFDRWRASKEGGSKSD